MDRIPLWAPLVCGRVIPTVNLLLGLAIGEFDTPERSARGTTGLPIILLQKAPARGFCNPHAALGPSLAPAVDPRTKNLNEVRFIEGSRAGPCLLEAEPQSSFSVWLDPTRRDFVHSSDPRVLQLPGSFYRELRPWRPTASGLFRFLFRVCHSAIEYPNTGGVAGLTVGN